MGFEMKITHKALKQSGAGLGQAVRRDMSAAIQQETDRVVLLGSGGEPLGVFPGASTYGITETAIDAGATYAVFWDAAIRFMAANAASWPSACNLLLRTEVYGFLDDRLAADAAPVWDWDRPRAAFNHVVMTTNGIAALSGDPAASSALLITAKNGVSPIFCGMWGGVDVIRDPYSDAKSGQLRLTALTTMDVTVARGVQLEILTGVQ